MYKEIGRKITSLTLLSILLASGVTFGMPGVIPAAEASHNANLFVSSESSQFNNYFAGPQVIEVVINDPNIADTDEGKGEPDVTVNSNKLRMVQATDGNWYGYFADRAQAQAADATQSASSGFGLSFGEFCDNNSDLGDVSVVTFTETVGVAIAQAATGGVSGTTTIEGSTVCTVFGAAANTLHVVREAKTPSNFPVAGGDGQIGIDPDIWPFVQLYNFAAGGNVIVKYNKGGGPQTTTLTFDTIPSNAISISLDRTQYPQSAQVHVTMADPQLNIDPTDEDSWTWGTPAGNSTVFYQAFNENGGNDAAFTGGAFNTAAMDNLAPSLSSLMFEKNGRLTVTLAAQSSTIGVLNDNDDQIFNSTLTASITQPMTFTELDVKSGVFGNYDEADNANLDTTATAGRGESATIRYNDVSTSVVVNFNFGAMAINVADGEWNSGEEAPVTYSDMDLNLNSRADEDLDLFEPVRVNLPSLPIFFSIPTMKIGSPFTLAGSGNASFFDITTRTNTNSGNFTLTVGSIVGGATVLKIEDFSDRGIVDPVSATFATTTDGALVIDLDRDLGDLKASIKDPRAVSSPRFKGLDMLNFDLRSLTSPAGSTTGITDVEAYLLVNKTETATTTGPGFTLAALDIDASDIRAYSLGNSTTLQKLINLNKTSAGVDTSAIYANIFSTSLNDNSDIALMFVLDSGALTFDGSVKPIVADLFTFGFTGDGLKTNERFNNAIYRFELEETGDNTGVFLGSAEFTMLNQLNILEDSTYEGLRTIDDEVTFIVHEDLTDEDAPKISIKDTLFHGPPGTETAQANADTHSGTVTLDKESYKIGELVVITLSDQDLNVDSDLIDIYITVTPVTGEPASDAVGKAGLGTLSNGDSFGRLLDLTFDDERWLESTVAPICVTTISGTGTGDGLTNVGFTMIETSPATGVFIGTFEIPTLYCSRNLTTPAMVSPTGTDIEVNYVDFRDGSGETIEVGDGAGVRANTGSISMDRSVYPLPFGKLSDFTLITGNAPNRQSFFPLHVTAVGTAIIASETIPEGDMTIHVRINDQDFNFGPFGLDAIGTFPAIANTATGFGPVKVTVSRGSDSVILAYAGATAAAPGRIDAGVKSTTAAGIRELGPITEIAPDAGIYEFDLPILYTDGPASSTCPTTGLFTGLNGSSTSTSSLARFDVAGSYCILQGDILTVEYTDPTDATGNPNTVTDSATFDIRNGVLQSDKSVYIIGADMILTLIEPDLDLDSDGAESYSLDLIEWDSDAKTTTMGSSLGDLASFDPEPSEFRETGDNTGIFQVVIEIPKTLSGERLDRGEEIQLEYTDWGPSGADFVGDEEEDINLTIYTSNFGATVELDQKVYTWTDKVFITIVAPDHNFDSNLIDEIGSSPVDKIQVSSRSERLSTYRLAETGTDTGIFTGEVILTGFSAHDADGDGTTGDASGTGPTGSGPTNGLLPAKDDDGLSVSFEFTEDETVVGSALIRWNIGEVQFLEASYPATGQGVIRVVDPDLNINPESVDNFDVDVWSDSDAGGIDLTVTETNEATGIFEGTVFFTVTDQSSGHRLRVAEGDTVTGEYEDNTLPNPYTTADELEISATTFIGTIVPPLERAPASNPRVVDAFGNELDEVSVDQQVQISADLANGQDRDQPFAYLVQISKDGVTYSLSWIAGSLAPGQALNPAQSWTPAEAGSYDVQLFVWESVDNPDALSPQVETTITVR